MPRRSTCVVWPDRGNAFYVSLAHDVQAGFRESRPRVRLAAAAELGAEPANALRDTDLIVVNPFECALSGSAFLQRAGAARRRVAVLSECVGTPWYRRQFKVGLRLDAVLDIGFTRQDDRHEPRDVPYRFVFNGPRSDERFTPPAASRPIPWAVVGHRTPDRARLVDELTRLLGPAGFAFLPALDRPGGANRRLGSETLGNVLRRTLAYVWRSHHSLPYYESFRFRDALKASAVPCKVDPLPPSDAPRTYRDVAELVQALGSAKANVLFEEATGYYASRSPLAENLAHALCTLDH